MAGLVCLSFYPADRVPLIELITLLTAMAWGARALRTRDAVRRGPAGMEPVAERQALPKAAAEREPAAATVVR
jgi:hypothetical protein